MQCNYVVSKLCNNMSFFATRVGCGSVWQLACSVVCDRICVEVLGWCDCVYVFSVALLCHSIAALNRIEAFWDSDLIVPNCIVSTLRCIDDWSIIVFFPIALCYSTIHTQTFLKEYHQTVAQKIFLLFLEIPWGLFWASYGFKLAWVPYSNYMKTISSTSPPPSPFTAPKKKNSLIL